MRFLRSCVVAGFVWLGGSGAANGQTLNTDEWREDLRHLARVIDDVHPNPYLFHDRTEFQQAIEELSASIPGMTEDEVMLGMVRISGLIRDGHSGLFVMSGRFPLKEFAPVRLRATPDGWIVVGVAAEHDWALGARVLEIAGRPADDVMATLALHTGADNESQQAYNAAVGLGIGRMLRGLGFVGESGILSLSVETDEGSMRALDLALITAPFSFQWTQTPFATPVRGTISIADTWSDVPLAFRHPGRPYWSEYVADEQLLYVQINQINDSDLPASVDGTEGVQSLTEFFATSLALTAD
ncbi:MAG: hypothetical protein OEM23_07235, partial [Gemmatimonadota bacterium]|nr:hypothetical protein [Gemmatimonadota bacterium]